ncbi:polysaccharide deacetylase family protein [Streptomyces sp. NBC_00102]|uniref:polysaccharide deacetylase family protein n=1 Tax=Streptomyces sp. NBC_00102 TaxID=2975652 RepID=UPI00224CE05D|nr:polysaccharide deacetylase family protein [Streptomyces sp. NBC_00102]MCX5399841.1 polysaccharide deacetylase family protein [Streptomyces sp. NBC_00102]
MSRPGRPGPGPVGAASVRAVLGLLALVLVALPFYAVWRYETHRRAVTPQAAPPVGARPVAGPPHGAGPGPAADAGAGATPPVVLAYHDIAPHGRSRYTVTPEAFDAQLAALARAGYRSLSTEEFVRYLDGGDPPARRSVYLTFDDGTHGLWVHADRILAKYRMRAAAFLITGSVGRHRPYYLSWQEIGRMTGTGRWDFEDHTHALHRRAAVDAAGTRQSVLSHRLWLPGDRRPEREDEYRARVAGDLDTSLAEFARHGLPRPRLFAYPFSEASEPVDSRTSKGILRHELAGRFAAALTNTTDRPLPAGRRAGAAGEVRRLEITRATDLRAFRAGLELWTATAPGDRPEPLGDTVGWEHIGAKAPRGPGVFTGRGPYPGRTGFAAASYRPLASADWTDYTLDVTVDRLREATNNVGIVVRDGSLAPVTVALSHSYVSLFAGTGDRRAEVARRTLHDNTVHRVRVTVRGDRTEVVVDGRFRIDWTEPRATGGNGRGGLALNIRNADALGEWPRFVSLRVASLPASAAEAGREAEAEGR